MMFLNSLIWSDHLLMITNIIAVLLILVVGIIVFSKESWKNITNRDIATISLLVALAIILNGFFSSISLAGYVKIRLGDVVVFYMGYRCKYILGYTGSIISDLLRILIFPIAGIHLGFTLNSCLFSLAGSISYQFNTKKFFYFIVSFLIIYILDSFVLNIIWLVSMGYIPWGEVAIYSAYINRIIELAWALPIYIGLLLLLYKVDKLI